MQDYKKCLGVVSGERFSEHGELANSYAQATNLLKSLGVKPNDAVAVLMRNDPEFLVATRAIMNADAYPVPVNWHAMPEDWNYIISDSGAKLLIAHADLAAKVVDALPNGYLVIYVATPPEIRVAFNLAAEDCRAPDDALDWRQRLASQPEQAAPPSEVRGAIMYTSGTTGRPKGVKRAPTRADVDTPMNITLNEVLRVPQGGCVRALIPGPLYHAAPNFWGLRASEPGSLAVLQPRFDEEDVLRLIERFAITHMFLVPTMIIRLLRLPLDIRSKYDISSLRRVVHSAAPISRQTKLELIEWLGPIVCEFYGGTENGVLTLLESDEWLAHPGSVGRLLDNCRISIRDDDGNELPPGQAGEIFGYNFNLAPFEYVNLPGLREKGESGSLFSIGDIGYLNEHGYLFLRDRKKDMIIVGGVNIYPAEIELALQSMPELKDSAVFGIPNAEYGEEVCAHVLPEEDCVVNAEAVTAWLRTRLPKYMIPRKIVIASSLPREASGKIMKRRIREIYWSDQEQKI